MIVNASDFAKLAEAIINHGAREAVKYLSPTERIKATRRTYKKATRRKADPIEILFTVGKPNYAERAFIKKAKKFDGTLPKHPVLKFGKKAA